MDQPKHKFTYTVNTKGIISYYALLLFNVGIISAKNHVLKEELREVYSHTSNFVITSILMSVICLIWLLQGASIKMFIWLGLTAVALNFIVELFIRLLNTPDVVDAVYGTAGAVVTLLIMLTVRRYGVTKTTS